MTAEAPFDPVRAIEAILMVADRPVEPGLLAQLLEMPAVEIEAACDELAKLYQGTRRGFMLVKVAGGYRFQSHPDLAAYVERFVLDGQSSRLSAAALETVAIIAYKQPISRAQVASIRGVNVDGVIRTLTQRLARCRGLANAFRGGLDLTVNQLCIVWVRQVVSRD